MTNQEYYKKQYKTWQNYALFLERKWGMPRWEAIRDAKEMFGVKSKNGTRANPIKTKKMRKTRRRKSSALPKKGQHKAVVVFRKKNGSTFIGSFRTVQTAKKAVKAWRNRGGKASGRKLGTSI